MTEYKYELEDLVSAAVAAKPLDFEQAFGSLVVDRIQNAVHDKKIQIAQQMYGFNDDDSDYEDNSEE
jgi:hypothetical protein